MYHLQIDACLNASTEKHFIYWLSHIPMTAHFTATLKKN